MLRASLAIFLALFLSCNAYAFSNKYWKPKVIHSWWKSKSGVEIYSPEWFDLAQNDGVRIFGRLESSNNNQRILINGVTAQQDADGYFFSPLEVPKRPGAFPIVTKVQTLKRGKWKTQSIETIVMWVDRFNRFSKPDASISCFQEDSDSQLKVNCSGSLSLDTDGQVHKYFWRVNEAPLSVIGENASFVFDSSGQQTIELTVVDDHGLQDVESIMFDVRPLNSAPIINLSSSQVEGTIPFASTLVADVNDPDGNLNSVKWMSTNGQHGEGFTFNLLINTPGTIKVTAIAMDEKGLKSQSTIDVKGLAPIIPDPSEFAPILPASKTATLADQASFLFEGPNAIQKEVAPGAINKELLAVVTGTVLDDLGQPISGVKVSFNQKDDFGYTFTRADGQYDLALTSGSYNLKFEHSDFINAQRSITTQAGGFSSAPEVMLVKLDENVTTIPLGTSQPHLAVGSSNTDERGERTNVLIIPSQTTAKAILPDNTEVSLDSTSIRITEFTVGEDGPKRMPASLPPASGYTFAVDFHVDEAAAMGAKKVQFDRPVYHYVDNFLGMPAGSAIPLATYDEEFGAWLPNKNGFILNILNVQNGIAQVDANGDGQIDDAATLVSLGLTNEELQTLGARYQAGDSLARYEIHHFSYTDGNYNIGTDDVPYPPNPNTTDELECPRGHCKSGSIINLQERSLGERIDLVGVDFDLYYNSKTDLFNHREREFNLRLSDNSNRSFKIRYLVNILGKVYGREVPGAPNLYHKIKWDGLNKYGVPVYGRIPVDVELSYFYKAYYRVSFDIEGNIASFGGIVYNPGRDRVPAPDVEIKRKFRIYLTNNENTQVVGNLKPEIHHRYDPVTKQIYFGNGSIRKNADRNVPVVKPFDKFFGATAKNPLTNEIYFTKYIDESGNYNRACIHKMTSSGEIIRVAGKAPCYETSNNIPTERYVDKDETKFIYINKMIFDEKGNLYFNDVAANIIYKLNTSSGSLERIAGTGLYPEVIDDQTFFQFSDQIAYEANFPFYSFTLGEQGWIYISTWSGIYMIHEGDDYKLRSYWYNTLPQPKILENITFDKTDGGIFYGNGADSFVGFEPNSIHLGKVLSNGFLSRLSGQPSGNPYCDFGIPCEKAAPESRLDRVLTDAYTHLKLDNGDFLVNASFFPQFGPENGQSGAVLLYKPNETFQIVAGGGSKKNDQDFRSPTLGSELQIKWSMENFLDMGDGKILVTTWNTNKSFIIDLARPNTNKLANEHVINDPDRGEIYVFDGSGKHLRTYDFVTNALKWSFEYNENGLLRNITDRNNLITQIVRDSYDEVTAIISPFGQKTDIFTYEKRVVGIINPAGEVTSFEYDANLMLSKFIPPKGNASTFEFVNWNLTSDTNAKGGESTITVFTNTANRLDLNYTSPTGLLEFHSTYFENGGVTAIEAYQDSGRERKSRVYRDEEFYESPRTWRYSKSALDPQSDFTSSYKNYSEVHQTDGFNNIFGFSVHEDRNLYIENGETVSKTTNYSKRGLYSNLQQDWSTHYDHRTRTLASYSPSGRETQIAYDDKGRVKKTVVPEILDVEFSYNSLGLLEEVSQGDRSTFFSYDALGRMVQVQNAKGEISQYGYDQANRVIFEKTPAGEVTEYSYDSNGNRTSITLPGQRVHNFSFDALDLESSYSPPLLDGSQTQTQMNYNIDKRLHDIQFPNGESLYFGYSYFIEDRYVASNELLKLDHYLANGGSRFTTIVKDFDDTGFITKNSVLENRSSGSSDQIDINFTYTGELMSSEDTVLNGNNYLGYIGYQYDDFFRLTSTQMIGLGQQANINYSYDQDDLLHSVGDLEIYRSQLNGKVNGTKLNNADYVYTYNEYGEVQILNSLFQGDRTYFEYVFVRDALGRITVKDDEDRFRSGQYVYSFDVKGQLTDVVKDGVEIASYTYDIRGNRLTSHSMQVPASYDEQDRLLSDGVFDYSYDVNGSLSSKTEISNGDSTLYEYDGLSNLRKVTLPDGRVIEYLIDGYNRRIGKRIDGNLVKTWTYKDQINPVIEVSYDEFGAGTAKFFIYATRPHVPDYMIMNDVRYTIVSDHLGSVRQVMNSQTGEMLQEQNFEAFGMRQDFAGEQVVPFGFAGGLYDEDTGLIRFGARDYDPHSGRWTTKDPIRFDGDAVNLYRYANNDPVNFVDPSGKVSKSAGEGAIALTPAKAATSLGGSCESRALDQTLSEAKESCSNEIESLQVAAICSGAVCGAITQATLGTGSAAGCLMSSVLISGPPAVKALSCFNNVANDNLDSCK